MNSGFGGYYPAVRRRRDKERMMFIGAAGFLFALTILLVVVLNYKESASAKEDRERERDSKIASANTMSTVALLAPSRYVRAGTKLSDVEMKQVFWPRNQVPDEAVMERGELREFFALKDLSPDVPLQKSFLTKTPGGGSLPVTPGNRAIAIEVSATEGIEGHAVAGTRVDVVLTFSEEGNLTSKVIVQNARVLSYGGDMGEGPGSQVARIRGPRTTSRTITLDVVPEDALKIATAKEVGRLSLMMRSGDDDKGLKVDQYDRFDIEGGKKKIKQGKSEACKKGAARIGSREFVMGCDGTIAELNPTEEP